MKTKNNLLLLLLLLVLPFTLQAETFNVKKYGARGNGKKMDSPAIQKAIDACHKAGGGTVRFTVRNAVPIRFILLTKCICFLEVHGGHC